MVENNISLLFLGKADDADCRQAFEYCERNFSRVIHCLGKWGVPFPDAARNWEGDYIVSYLSRWVVPDDLLRAARKAAINFHPAPPEYPGIGCNNFALYENAKEYGVTCHHMAPKVDTGRIIAVRRFPIYDNDDVEALLKRTYEYQLSLFFEMAKLMTEGKELPFSQEIWTRPPFTRKQFNELFKITPEMDKDEIARRVRALTYGPYRPYVEIKGYKFVYADRK